MSGKTLPLKGIKILELGTYLAVPVSVRLLAEWGAEVIKVEGPRGDDWRLWGVMRNVNIDPKENPIFAYPNMSKKTIVLDLKKPEGVKIFKELMAESDIFVTNIRHKSLVDMGIDYDSVKGDNPRLIYGEFSGYGSKGAEADRPGFDYAAFWARGGFVDTVAKGSHPPMPPAGVGDCINGSTICIGLLVALLNRNITGKGTYLESSLLASAMWYNSFSVIAGQKPYSYPFDDPYMFTRPNNPLSGAYETSDGEWIQIMAGTYSRNYGKMLGALGLEEYLEDERFNTHQEVKKPENSELFTKIVQERFKQYTAQEMCTRLEEHDVVHERMRHYKEMAYDEQAHANGYLEEVEFRDGSIIVQT